MGRTSQYNKYLSSWTTQYIDIFAFEEVLQKCGWYFQPHFFLASESKKTAKNDISGTSDDDLLFPDMSFLISENVHHIPVNVVFCCLSVSSGSEIFHFFAQQFAHDEVCQP